MVFHQYDYLFAIGTIFALLDAWNIGANDVANSWATSVASRSVTYLQAMCLASIMEFSGSMGVGARVADTIRTKIVDTDLFSGKPELLMLGMVCAIVGSSSYLTFATRIGLPVSTTHSILGGVLGMGIASVGANGIMWVGKGGGTKVIQEGVVQVFLAWIIAPIMSGCFAALIFLVTKFGVMLRNDPARRALILVPIYFMLTACLLAMLLIWKGGNYEVNLTDQQIPGVIVGVGAGWAILVAIFLVPWLWRVVIRDDWQLRWWHIPMGPLLLRRGEVPPAPDNSKNAIRNFYEGHLTMEELEARRNGEAARGDVEAVGAEHVVGEKQLKSAASGDGPGSDAESAPKEKVVGAGTLAGPRPEGAWYRPAVLFWFVKFAVFRGVDMDVVSSQSERTTLGGDVEEMHARASHYDNKAEYMYSFLQIMTAATASFTHGANDISNAVGPYATIFEIWNTEKFEKKSQVPNWILGVAGAALVIGLWTYGYHIMRNLGNRLTLQSPSRGFSMELGSVITIVVATRLKLPISTTQCITGATVGVGLCSGDYRTVNWRMVAWIYMGWIITLPVTGIISGCLMGIIINAPRW